MAPRSRLATVLLSASAVLALPATAGAVTYPKITSVSPMKAAIGEKMTIKGRNFRSGRNANTVVFQAKRGAAVFVKAPSATKTKITLVLPEKLAAHLKQSEGEAKPTRFRLRVLARRFGLGFTASKSSPVIGPEGSGSAGPVDCDSDGQDNGADLDDDNDLLSDVREGELKTDACRVDTDGDGVSDYFEVESALDLNSRAVPYPGKRPFPNALDPSDAKVDYDGDAMTLAEEHAMWAKFGKGAATLNYSDGDQTTGPPQLVPQIPSGALLNYWEVGRVNGVLSDDEKDADGDLLTNYDEAHGRMLPEFWDKTYGDSAPTSTCAKTAETVYPLKYEGTDFLDADTDGDGVIDGRDDQDHDGFSNIMEIDRPADWALTYVSGAVPASALPCRAGLVPNRLARVNPYNPCKPYDTGFCELHPAFGYYEDQEDWYTPAP